MILETITWYVFPGEVPEEMKKEVATKVLIKLKSIDGAVAAKIDKSNHGPVGVNVHLDCTGVDGGTVVTNEVQLIAFRPLGRIDQK